MKTTYPAFFLAAVLFISACGPSNDKKEIINPPVIGFLDLQPDETLDQARKGFFTALNDSGYNEKDHTIEIIYRNAQGDQPTCCRHGTT